MSVGAWPLLFSFSFLLIFHSFFLGSFSLQCLFLLRFFFPFRYFLARPGEENGDGLLSCGHLGQGLHFGPLSGRP